MNMQSEHINELMGALSKAQGEMSYAVKDSHNPHFKSKYSDLASICRACREPFAKHGLAVSQTMDILGDRQVLITTLGHSSGQYIKSIAFLPIMKPGPQEIVSCIKYMRRCSLSAIAGVYDDDDDGELVQSTYREAAKVPETPKGLKLNEAQCAALDMALKEFPEKRQGLCEKYSLKEVYDLEQSLFGYVMQVFEQCRKEKKKTPEKDKAV